MKDDYPLIGKTCKIEIELEKEVFETMKKMVNYQQLSSSEIINTALKRFISQHKDYLPASVKK